MMTGVDAKGNRIAAKGGLKPAFFVRPLRSPIPRLPAIA